MSSLPQAKPEMVMMFHIGRSGSRVLGDMLQQHPALSWDHEAFVARLQEARRQGLANPVGDPIKILQKRSAIVDPTLCFGTEVKFFHLRLFGRPLTDFVHQVLELGFKRFVVLKRRNFLRKIVSSLVARQTNEWHRRPQKPNRLTPIFVDVNRVAVDWAEQTLLDHLHQFTADFKLAESVLRPYSPLNLVYETDIQMDPAQGYTKMCQFLDVPKVEVQVRYGRSNPFRLDQIIKNYDEVAHVLQDSPFEWMLHDEMN